MVKNPATYFLELVKRSGKSPNFWMSKEYIKLAGLTWYEFAGIQGFQDGEHPGFFPYYLVEEKRFVHKDFQTGFQDETFGKFWDFEFIYDPKEFLDLSGGHWKIFRKNIRKWQNKPWLYGPVVDDEPVIELYLKWAKGKTLYDPETFTRFVLEGKNRFGLYLGSELKGVNIADTNFKYINYRICFDTGEKYLNEFLRWKFYTSEWVQSQNKLVNDGGCLGSEGLRRFKEKLNPIYKKVVYTGVENESE